MLVTLHLAFLINIFSLQLCISILLVKGPYNYICDLHVLEGLIHTQFNNIYMVEKQRDDSSTKAVL